EPALVSGRETGANLAGDLNGFVGREPADAPNKRSQIFAIDIFHGEKRNAVSISDVENAANIGMRHLPRDAHLGVESRQRLRILRQAGWQELNGHDLAELQIFRAIDFA